MDGGLFTQWAWLVSGLLLGSLLLLAGLAAGMWLGRRVDSESPRAQLPAEQVVRTLGGLFQWSSGMAVDVKEYRHELERLANSVQEQGETVDPQAAVGLLLQVVAANEKLQGRLDEAESALKSQAEEVAAYLTEARTDALTGLPNRRALDDELARSLAEWRRYGVPMSVLLVDVDHFKGLNDRYGHLAGDAVLAGVARTLQEVLRECDLVARFGGEEFAMLLPHTDAVGAGLAAERVRRGIEEARYTFEGTHLPVKVSCGVGQALAGDEAVALLKRCDEALYSAKRGGRNRAHLHTGETIIPLLNGAPSNQPIVSAGGATAAQPSALERACHDLRRRLLEVTRN